MVLKLKSPYRDGTPHIVMQPQEFMQRLATLVPRPRLHRIRFHWVLAPNSKLRAAVIPQPARMDSAPWQEHTQGQAARMRWARLRTSVPARAGYAARSGEGVLARLCTLIGEQDDGSAAEPTDMLGP